MNENQHKYLHDLIKLGSSSFQYLYYQETWNHNLRAQGLDISFRELPVCSSLPQPFPSSASQGRREWSSSVGQLSQKDSVFKIQVSKPVNNELAAFKSSIFEVQYFLNDKMYFAYNWLFSWLECISYLALIFSKLAYLFLCPQLLLNQWCLW